MPLNLHVYVKRSIESQFGNVSPREPPFHIVDELVGAGAVFCAKSFFVNTPVYPCTTCALPRLLEDVLWTISASIGSNRL